MPGENPLWSVGAFYNLLVSRDKIPVSEKLLEAARAQPRAMAAPEKSYS